MPLKHVCYLGSGAREYWFEPSQLDIEQALTADEIFDYYFCDGSPEYYAAVDKVQAYVRQQLEKGWFVNG